MQSLRVCILVHVLVIGFCMALGTQLKVDKCKPSSHEIKNINACIEKIKGVTTASMKDLSSDEKEEIRTCIAQKNGILSEDKQSFNETQALANIDEYEMTPEVKQGLKDIVTSCTSGKDKSTKAEEILACIHPKIHEYCKPTSA